MSPENGFKFRTGHNGTQLGQWQLGVCSVYVHVCGASVEQVQVLCGAHVWSTCVLVQVLRICTCVTECSVEHMCASASATLSKFPGSLQCQDSGHHPLGKGPAISHFYTAVQLDNIIQLTIVLILLSPF